MQAYENGDDIAVHTYTHPHLTTLSNAQVVAELGWTMQIIYDSTNGKIPRFWRSIYTFCLPPCHPDDSDSCIDRLLEISIFVYAL
jgi:peptidoglycan/xylan/chitin deacetylase (PgdA/CDA1 family)